MQEPVYPTPSNSRLPRLLWILAALCLGLVLPYLAEQMQYSITRGELRARADAAAEDLDDLAKNAQLVKLSDTSRAFRDVAKRVEPSVVHIDTEQAVRGGNRAFSIEGFEFLLPPGHGQQFAQGQGSGVIVDGDEGYVLTNYHVIQGADKIVIRLSDGRSIADEDVAVVGYDESTDLAVLRVSAVNLTGIDWGDSEALEVGDWVLAVGSPYGLDRTVTSGIVSAKQRRGVSQLYQDFLQTDAAVNPGNSGGPLLNVEGKLVGITTAIVGRAFQGISFAIPSKVAKDVYERLKTGGEVVRGWLGVELQALTPQIAERLKLSSSAGALVVNVLPGAPAEKGGMKPGDVIVEWNGIDVVNEAELPLLVARTEVGSTVKVVVIRDGERVSLDVTVDERPPEHELQRRRPGNR